MKKINSLLFLSRGTVQRHQQRLKPQSAFTIVELLIVIVVIGILATIVIVAYNGIEQRAHVAALQSDLKSASSQLGIDNVNNGNYPAAVAAANGGQGLKASPGTTWQYTYASASNAYCITGTNSGVSYFVSSDNQAPQSGACPGDVNGGVATLTCPSGFIVVPGSSTYGTSDFCTMKYEASQVGSTAVPISQAGSTPWVNISQTTAIADSPNVAGCSGCHLMTEAEYLTIAQNVLSVASNWSGGSIGSGYIYSGHNDNAPASALDADSNDSNGYSGETNTGGNQRRTLTLANGAVIWDLAGNVYEWTQSTIAGNAQPGFSGETIYAWKDYSDSNLIQNGLPSSAYPSFGTPAASAWTSTQGIGRLYSDYGNGSTSSFARGGYWGDSSYAGVLALYLHGIPSTTGTYIGFRVSQ